VTLSDRLAALAPEQKALFEKLRDKQRRTARRHQPPPVPRVSGPTGEGDWPLSLDQERFWFMEQLFPDGAGLNLGAATRMRGRVAVPMVAAALDEIARRHGAWRTTFPLLDGRPVQRVAASRRQRLAIIDLVGLPEERREPEALRLVGEETAASFDLELGPLVRSSLIRLAPEDHLCLLTIHHLVTDWISFQIVWGELAALCDAGAAGRPAALPEPPVHYSDFAIWQREWLRGEVLDGLVSWWRERLEDFPLMLDLPTDRPRPPVARMRGGLRLASFSPELSEGLRAFARREGATLFMAVLAAVAALFHRTSSQEKLLLGANNANRNRPEIEPVLGCFLTQLPFPVDLEGNPPFRELLARVRHSALGVYAHQDLPFGKLVEAIQPARDTSRQPIVQTLIQVLDGQPSAAALSGVSFEAVYAFDGNARYDLMLSLFDDPGGFMGWLEYDADLFDGGTAQRLLDRLQLLLEAAIADAGRRLESLPLLTAAEQNQLLRDEHTPPLAPAPGRCIHDLIAERVRLSPGSEAVVCGAERLTYRELDERAEALALRLRINGVGPETPVGVCMERSAALVVGLLGVLKAGGVYLPIDPEESPSRIAFVLEDSGAAALLTETSLGLRLPAVEIPRVFANDLPSLAPHPLPPIALLAANVAYVIYTSGSTGLPKGVAVSHGAVAEHVGAWTRLHGIGEADRLLQFNSASFDPAVEQCFAALISGATLVMRGSDLWDSGELSSRIATEAVTVVDLPTAYWDRWIADTGEAVEVPPSLRKVLVGGEELRAASVRRWSRTPLAQVPLLNAYGPTEAVVSATLHLVMAGDGEAGSVPIGRPLPGRIARVLGFGRDRQPAGVPGELYLGGPLARGYLCRPDLTAERFVPDPFAGLPGSGTEPGARLYRTGDLARWRPDGNLEFLGRIDEQVKIRGFRVEPGEVSAALRAHPAVGEVEVMVRAGTRGDRQLVAYFAATGAVPSEEDLRRFLRQRLPEHMLPAAFVALAELPLTVHGKVDRQALPVPATREALAGSAAPRTAREELLAGIWREVLGLDRVGIHDNFFQLGGDSILSIQVVARARRAGLLVTTRQFFDHQTIAGLAAVAGEAGAPGDSEGPVEGEAPLTPIQRCFFAEEQREPWRFNQAVMLAPRERLAAAPLAAALARLAEHHDALRLRFVREEDCWRQIHAPAGAAGKSAPLLEIDLAALPPEERSRALDGAAEQLQSGLDLATGPLFTAALFRLGKEAGERLLLTAHHLIVDGVSWRVLLEDLTAAYRRLVAGAAPELPAKTTSWKRWAEHLAGYAGSTELAAELPYWLALPVAPAPLPLDLEGDECAMATVSVELGAAATCALLNEAPEAYRTQVNDLLLAALARAFAAWTGEGTLLMDLEGHGREEIFPGVDLSRTVGWFTTVFPVALALPPGAGPREAIQTVKEILRSVPRRGLGYGLLRYLAGSETGERLAALPTPQVSFNYLGRFDAVVGEGGLFAFAPEVARGAEGEALPGRHLFQIDLLVLEDRLRVHWTYDPGRHLPETVDRLAYGFLAEIETLIAHCLSPEAGGFTPSDFPLARLDQAALDRLLGNGRGVEDLYPLAPMQEGILFHSLFTTGADLYFEQLTAELEGPLDVPAFTGAWQQVVERHAALRTSFLVAGVERPLQLVRREAELPWTVEDWRDLPSGDLEQRWRHLLAVDRAQGFDLARPPLMRLTLVRTGEGSHRLVWSSHHLIFDGWCFSLLLAEVFALYEGAPLPPRPRPYRDYVAWLADRDDAEAERYWQQRLRGFTPTPVPFDRPEAFGGRHAGRAGDYFEETVSLPALRVAEVEALVRRLQVTLSTLVQAAWALLLSRYARTSDVVFGAVVSGRPAELSGVESMVGLFINTLLVRIQVPDGEAASAWLSRLQAEQFELHLHEWTSLTRIQSLAELPIGEPLFASLVVFENYPLAPSVSERMGKLRIREAAVTERTNYPLTLTAVARGDLTLRLIADRRFEPATMQRLLAHLKALLEALIANPEASPSKLPLLSAAERHQLSTEWNDSAALYPDRLSIPELFAEQVALRRDAVAVEQGEERLTYFELQQRAERLACRLVAMGIRPEESVAVLAERSPDLIAGLLGILKAGGAYLPLDPSHPPQRLAWMMRDAGASLLLAGSTPEIDLPEGLRLVDPSGDEPEVAGELPDVPAEGLAYMMYTSGSTGTPKGVAVTHRNVIRLVRGAGYADMDPDQAWLQYAPIAFDASTLEIWAPLLNGGRLVMFPGASGSLEDLTRVIEGHGVTSAWLTAGLFHEMVDGSVEGLRPLRQLLTGGDVVSPEHARKALESLPGLNLIDGYGPTEGTTFTSCCRITEPRQVRVSISIGRPIANARIHVLDACASPLPIGAWEELHAGGDGLARGYLNRPDLTAERFVPDPFAGPDAAGSRLYRTGDLVRWRADGNLEFQGRLDSQIKIRGFRVEPAEVEKALLACPGVLRAAVVGVGETGNKKLAAFWVGEAQAMELRSELRSRLPEVMVPAIFVPLPELPLTPNGKVDRRALAAMAESDAGAVRPMRERVPPRTFMEEMVVRACAEVLGREPEEISVMDNFFELGGHSILATRLVSRLSQEHGMSLALQMVFEEANLGELAERMAQQELESASDELLGEVLREMEAVPQFLEEAR
jgi:amino acid adenylation domain-containing protein/non-ribosomal peptide synthase protein (TIGR01720 family)